MNIAIVQLGRIGDLVLVTSAIKLIKEKYPESKIFFIVGPSNYHILTSNPNIEKILVFEKNPFKLFLFLLKFKTIHFDYYLDVKDHFSNESLLLAKIANAKIKIGFNDKARKNKNVFDIGIPSDKENIKLHFVERITNILTYIGISKSITLPLPQIFLEKSADDFVNLFLHSFVNSKFIMLNISASKINKMWTIKKWIEFIHRIKLLTDIPLIISSDSIHFEMAENISETTSIIHFPPSTLSVVSALISQAELLISPDTSLIHIASSFNIPVIALTNYVPWSITKFYPLSTKNAVVLPELEGHSVSEISVEQVVSAFININK
jgi:ADP-heptose:LPS heptosyltransferase